ncbi:hypothetical protein ACPPVT_07400 [Angustibacter sp. McL0619]|uniref:hypothetical protein n=1 Tax=Angustibacter sp. McL0619 TaxID=3415676 RepID=UPI003CF8B84A
MPEIIEEPFEGGGSPASGKWWRWSGLPNVEQRNASTSRVDAWDRLPRGQSDMSADLTPLERLQVGFIRSAESQSTASMDDRECLLMYGPSSLPFVAAMVDLIQTEVARQQAERA